MAIKLLHVKGMLNTIVLPFCIDIGKNKVSISMNNGFILIDLNGFGFTVFGKDFHQTFNMLKIITGETKHGCSRRCSVLVNGFYL